MRGGDAHDLLGGREQAYEPDPIWCPVRKTMGGAEQWSVCLPVYATARAWYRRSRRRMWMCSVGGELPMSTANVVLFSEGVA